ncbi:facilitated trehalose transporter Tret1 isoform X1 [Leptinotarsa decemlineata]|uniref:facilitated trehalose transporter Tret1 isoform X1 n=1 Tax=Leptinotarsa decemlineata TaxID=7539 RepID=UPI003D3040D5
MGNLKEHEITLQEVIYKPKSSTGGSTKLNQENEEKKMTSPFLYFVSFIVNLMSATFGILAVWISPVSLKLLSNNSDINPLEEPVTPVELSLLGSLPVLGNLIGFLLVGNCFDIYGRRKGLLVISAIITADLICLAFSTHIVLYYIFLFMNGFAFAAGMLGTTMYSSEISEDHNRAKLACFISMGLPLGSLFGYAAGPICSVKLFTLLCTLPMAIYFVIFITILPESPVYLIMKGNINGAKIALSRLRNKSHRFVSKEVETIEIALSVSSKSETSATFVSLVKNKSTRKRLILANMVWAFAFLTGAPGLMSFLGIIFEESGTGVSPFISSIVAATVQVICAFVASFIVESYGRRCLLLISSLGCSIPLSLLGLFFWLKQQGSPLMESIGWMPVTSVILFCIVNGIGFGCVPMVLLSEIFPVNVRPIAISFIMVNNDLIMGFVIFLFPIMMSTFGLYWVFWIHSLLCIISFIFIYFYLPETKGKSVLEMEKLFT